MKYYVMAIKLSNQKGLNLLWHTRTKRKGQLLRFMDSPFLGEGEKVPLCINLLDRGFGFIRPLTKEEIDGAT
jgi:hypothetical protein